MINETLLQTINNDNFLKKYYNKNVGDYNSYYNITLNKNCPKELLLKITKSAIHKNMMHFGLYLNISRHKNIDIKILKLFCKSENLFIRQDLCKSNKIDLYGLCQIFDYEVYLYNKYKLLTDKFLSLTAVEIITENKITDFILLKKIYKFIENSIFPKSYTDHIVKNILNHPNWELKDFQ